MKNYKINRLKYKAQIGTFKDSEQYNQNTGMPLKTFVATKSLWFGEYRVKIAQKPYANEPYRVNTTKLIVIRHDTKISTDQIVKIQDSLYRIVDIEPDSDTINGLDVLTLQSFSTNASNNFDAGGQA